MGRPGKNSKKRKKTRKLKGVGGEFWSRKPVTGKIRTGGIGIRSPGCEPAREGKELQRVSATSLRGRERRKERTGKGEREKNRPCQERKNRNTLLQEERKQALYENSSRIPTAAAVCRVAVVEGSYTISQTWNKKRKPNPKRLMSFTRRGFRVGDFSLRVKMNRVAGG